VGVYCTGDRDGRGDAEIHAADMVGTIYGSYVAGCHLCNLPSRFASPCMIAEVIFSTYILPTRLPVQYMIVTGFISSYILSTGIFSQYHLCCQTCIQIHDHYSNCIGIHFVYNVPHSEKILIFEYKASSIIEFRIHGKYQGDLLHYITKPGLCDLQTNIYLYIRRSLLVMEDI
jgi:hypothetical protein